MRGRLLGAVLLIVTLCVVMSACAPGPNAVSEIARSGPQAAGFWLGLWHGLIIPVTFVVSLFTSSVSIYEVVNNGNWYDFGFVIGVSLVFSGPAGSRRGARRLRRKTS